MGSLKNIFAKKKRLLRTIRLSGIGFQKMNRLFSKCSKQKNGIERNLFDKILPRLNKLREGYFLLAGMWDKDTSELIITTDGIIKNIAFAEALHGC
jgi:hypothetical protein